ncbi:MAG: hypothetical protein NC299_11665 [Lachnospiraceae bacterium]|nr:hypothetical protein [Ruminococcus sp.]MCM1275999.1 hypothetical protein [Lachnospiraceae bacterium]
MEQPIIASTEQARDFYIRYLCHCPRGSDLYEAFSPEILSSYEEHSSEELEKQWAFEEFDRYFSQISLGNKDNNELLDKAWEWQKESTPVKYIAEKLEIMMSECDNDPSDMLIERIFETAVGSDVDKNSAEDEKALRRLLELCEPYITSDKADKLRFRIIGPETEEEAKQLYVINRFSDKHDSRHFRTLAAERNFQRFATPENLLKWKQEYFDEHTEKSFFIDADALLVSFIELIRPRYGIYSDENLQKLYDKLSDYKNCAAPDQYWRIAYSLERSLSQLLYDDGKFDLLEKFYKLAADILDDAPDSWDKEYFGSQTLDSIKEYRGLMNG